MEKSALGSLYNKGFLITGIKLFKSVLTRTLFISL